MGITVVESIFKIPSLHVIHLMRPFILFVFNFTFDRKCIKSAFLNMPIMLIFRVLQEYQWVSCINYVV